MISKPDKISLLMIGVTITYLLMAVNIFIFTPFNLHVSTYLSIYLSSAVRDILARYSENPDAWDSTLLDSARGSVIYAWAEKEETVENLLSQGWESSCANKKTNVNKMYTEAYIKDVQETAKGKWGIVLTSFHFSYHNL